MSNRKEEISYYDLGGREAEMYRAIDEFLGLSKRYSPQAVRRKRIIGVVAGIIGTMASMLFMLVTSMVLLFLISVLISGWLVVYFAFSYGKKPFPDVERVNSIIERDGLENVYNDLVHAKHIDFTYIHVGDEYLFKRGKVMCRIKNIARTYIRVVSDDDSTSYYASIEAYDETGKLNIDIKQLTEFTSKNRQRTFEELVKPIEEKRYRLKKLEDQL